MAKRTRCYVAIGYPESLDTNWVETLKETHIQTLISPLHNMDTDENGELKKEHYHIMLLFDSLKTIEQAQTVFDSIKATKCQAVNSIRGQARYLCHLDDIDKYPYDTGDVMCLNGADYFSMIELPTNKYLSIREMQEFIEYNNIVSFSKFFQYCSQYNETWFRSLCDNSAFIIKEYLKARQWTVQAEKSGVCNVQSIDSYSMPPTRKEAKNGEILLCEQEPAEPNQSASGQEDE